MSLSRLNLHPLLLLLLLGRGGAAQQFTVARFNTRIDPDQFAQGPKPIAYKIVSTHCHNIVCKLAYPLEMGATGKTKLDTLALIAELLRFKGDTRLCCLPIMCYSVEASQIYAEKARQYSLQLEALFLINQLYFKHPFRESPYPVLYDPRHKQFARIAGHLLVEAYRYYEQWYAQVKRLGLRESRKQNLAPLANASFHWYW